MDDQGDMFNFTSSDGETVTVSPKDWWKLMNRFAPPSFNIPPAKDPCVVGRWYRSRFFGKGTDKGPLSRVSWDDVVSEWSSNRNGLSAWQTSYPLWIEDRILVKLGVRQA